MAVWHNPTVFHVGDVIRKRRNERGWTIEELAEQAHVNKATVSQVERGEANYRRETLDKIARALDLSGAEALFGLISWGAAAPDSVLTQAGSNADPDVADTTGYKRRDIPVIQEGEASPNGTFWSDEGTPRQQVDEWMSRPFDLRDQHAYAVVLRGDSMEPMLKQGYRLIVSPNLSPSDGELSYTQLASGERLVKVARRAPGGWILESYNNAYPPRFVTDAEVVSIHRVAYVRTLR